MSVYLDASVLVALFVIDPFSVRSSAYLRTLSTAPLVSDFAAAEFASALAIRVRRRDLTKAEARASFASFDAWTARAAQPVNVAFGDIAAAGAFVRRLDLNLRAPDALNIVLAQRAGAILTTFDQEMAKNARALGLSVAEI